MSGKKGIDAFTNPSSAKIEQQRKIMEKIKKSNDTFTNPSSAKIEQQIRIMEEIKKILEVEKRKNQLMQDDQTPGHTTIYPKLNGVIDSSKNVTEGIQLLSGNESDNSYRNQELPELIGQSLMKSECNGSEKTSVIGTSEMILPKQERSTSKAIPYNSSLQLEDQFVTLDELIFCENFMQVCSPLLSEIDYNAATSHSDPGQNKKVDKFTNFVTSDKLDSLDGNMELGQQDSIVDPGNMFTLPPVAAATSTTTTYARHHAQFGGQLGIQHHHHQHQTFQDPPHFGNTSQHRQPTNTIQQQQLYPPLAASIASYHPYGVMGNGPKGPSMHNPFQHPQHVQHLMIADGETASRQTNQPYIPTSMGHGWGNFTAWGQMAAAIQKQQLSQALQAQHQLQQKHQQQSGQSHLPYVSSMNKSFQNLPLVATGGLQIQKDSAASCNSDLDQNKKVEKATNIASSVKADTTDNVELAEKDLTGQKCNGIPHQLDLEIPRKDEKIPDAPLHIQQQQQPPDAKEILVNATENLREYELPYGWFKRLSRRRSGVCENKWDTYLSSPTKDRFRSNRELETYLKAHPEVEFDPEVTKVQKPTKDDPYFLAMTSSGLQKRKQSDSSGAAGRPSSAKKKKISSNHSEININLISRSDIDEGKEYTLDDIKNMDLKPEIKEDGTKIYRCFFCTKSCKHKLSTIQHMVSTHTNHRYKCDTCGKEFRHQHALKGHISVEHEQLHEGKPAASKEKLSSNHSEIKLEEGKEYSIDDIKNIHLEPDIAEDGTKSYKCLFCSNFYKQKHGTMQHMISIHTNHRYECAACGKKFRHQQALKGHISVEHEQIHEGTGRPEKKKDISNPSERKLIPISMVAHVVGNYNMPSKPGSLPSKKVKIMAAKSASSSSDVENPSDLKNEQKYTLDDINNMDLNPEITKEGTKIYKCFICKKAYKQKMSTIQHMISVHTNHRYECDTCGKAFRHQQALKVHNTTSCKLHADLQNTEISKIDQGPVNWELFEDSDSEFESSNVNVFKVKIEPTTSRALRTRNCKPKRFLESSEDESFQSDNEQEENSDQVWSDLDDDTKTTMNLQQISAENYVEIPCQSEDPVSKQLEEQDEENPTYIIGSIKLDSMELDSPNTLINYIELSELPIIPCGSDLEQLEMIKTVEKSIVASINVDTMELDFDSKSATNVLDGNLSEESIKQCELEDLEVQNILASNTNVASSSKNDFKKISEESIVALAIQNLPGKIGTTLEVFHWIHKEFYEYNISISTIHQVLSFRKIFTRHNIGNFASSIYWSIDYSQSAVIESLEKEISMYTQFPSYIDVKFTNAVSKEISAIQIAEEDSILKDDLQVSAADMSFNVCDKVKDGNHMPKSNYAVALQSNPCYPKPKPAYSYLHLITLAFLNSSEKELSRPDIQRFIMKQFPYFKRKAPVGWKNVIMYNFKKHILRHLNGSGFFEKVSIRTLKAKESIERIEHKPSKPWKKWRMNLNKANVLIEELRTWTNRKLDTIRIGMNDPDLLPDLLKGIKLKSEQTLEIHKSKSSDDDFEDIPLINLLKCPLKKAKSDDVGEDKVIYDFGEDIISTNHSRVEENNANETKEKVNIFNSDTKRDSKKSKKKKKKKDKKKDNFEESKQKCRSKKKSKKHRRNSSSLITTE